LGDARHARRGEPQTHGVRRGSQYDCTDFVLVYNFGGRTKIAAKNFRPIASPARFGYVIVITPHVSSYFNLAFAIAT
jgi:hypothetical protein